MAFFSKDFIAFFKELSENNSKNWFDENRKRYEKEVKKPFSEFVTKMIALINSDDPTITMQSKEAIFRINRDIRFSKDKTPYKTNVSAAISRGGRKDHTTPGIYYELRADGISIYGGVYQCDKNQLHQLRSYILENYDLFEAAIADKDFSSHFGEILGEKNKVIPKDFKAYVDEKPLLANKQFYYSAHLPAKHITSNNLDEVLFEYYLASKSVKEFLTNALSD